jgi:hypothetical protein
MSDQVTRQEEKGEGICGEDWWESDRMDAIGWALAFIWGALVLLAEPTGFAERHSWWDGWGVFFVGAGTIVLAGTVVRLLIPAYRRKIVTGLIFGLILLAIGVGDEAPWEWVWPTVLGAIGIAINRNSGKEV